MGTKIISRSVGRQKRYPRSLEWPQRTKRLLTEHGWSEVVKFAGKSRKKYELSITNVEADLNFIIPKTIPLILYPQKFFLSSPLSLELFLHLSLMPKTPNRASKVLRVTYLKNSTKWLDFVRKIKNQQMHKGTK